MSLRGRLLPWLLLASVGVAVLPFSGCITQEGDPALNVNDLDNPFRDCLPVGANCGGTKLCCPGSICKGRKCSPDRFCTGPGGLCHESSECCGTQVCRGAGGRRDGFCDGSRCQIRGQRCNRSADCCGTLVCNRGICGD